MDTKPLYSIWLPAVGWLKINDDYYADPLKEKADEAARYIGMGAQVRLSDTNIMAELEALYLEQERRTLWHYFKKLLERKTNKYELAK